MAIFEETKFAGVPLQVMAEMRHPHVVQFLGLCFLEGSALPVLVMERLDNSLDNLLETSPGLPLALKLSLLTDVARGLVYLHTHNPPVVHRDLSARNVLLTSSLVAKISDLGNARIVNLQPDQLARTLTPVPGTQAYMPPESFDEGSRYGPRLDIFSFGHLALFTLTQVRREQAMYNCSYVNRDASFLKSKTFTSYIINGSQNQQPWNCSCCGPSTRPVGQEPHPCTGNIGLYVPRSVH